MQNAFVKAYVGVTDGDWYQFLSARPEIGEVNFWRPGGGREFHVLTPGEPFFFKSHFPHNKIVGGGFYSGFAALRVSEAWEFFDEGNGVASLAEMRLRVGRYRRAAHRTRRGSDHWMRLRPGHPLLRDNAIADPPRDFATNIVQGKGYDLAVPGIADEFAPLMARLLDADIEVDVSKPWHRPGPVYGDPRLRPAAPRTAGVSRDCATCLPPPMRHHRSRRSVQCFRPPTSVRFPRAVNIASTTACCSALMYTSCTTAAILASIPDIDLIVSPRLREEFGNGESSMPLRASRSPCPNAGGRPPNREFLQWHLDEVFKAA